MKKVMISQPMRDKTDEEILAEKAKAVEVLTTLGYEVVDSFFQEEFKEEYLAVNKGVFYLGKSLEKMSQCEAVYFCKDWENYRGCKLEHEVAMAYGLEVIYHAE